MRKIHNLVYYNDRWMTEADRRATRVIEETTRMGIPRDRIVVEKVGGLPVGFRVLNESKTLTIAMVSIDSHFV